MTDLVKKIESNPQYGDKIGDVQMGVPIRSRSWGPKGDDASPDLVDKMKNNASAQDRRMQDIIQKYENMPGKKSRTKAPGAPKKKGCDIRGFSKLRKAELIKMLQQK